MSAPIATLLAYIGGFIAWIMAYSGTCTGDVADNLFVAILSFPFYVASLSVLALGRSHRATLVAALLLTPLILWQAAFSMNLTFRILALGWTACEVLWGPPYGPDGSELTYVVLWSTMGFGLPTALALLVWHQSRRR
jgi:hypothetical protein